MCSFIHFFRIVTADMHLVAWKMLHCLINFEDNNPGTHHFMHNCSCMQNKTVIIIFFSDEKYLKCKYSLFPCTEKVWFLLSCKLYIISVTCFVNNISKIV